MLSCHDQPSTGIPRHAGPVAVSDGLGLTLPGTCCSTRFQRKCTSNAQVFSSLRNECVFAELAMVYFKGNEVRTSSLVHGYVIAWSGAFSIIIIVIIISSLICQCCKMCQKPFCPVAWDIGPLRAWESFFKESHPPAAVFKVQCWACTAFHNRTLVVEIKALI